MFIIKNSLIILQMKRNPVLPTGGAELLATTHIKEPREIFKQSTICTSQF